MMELLHSRAVPGPEFVSLSVLLRTDTAGGDAAPVTCHPGGGGEPFLLSGPLSTVSRASCKRALAELHLYVNSVLKASGTAGGAGAGGKTTTAPNETARFLREDEKFLFGSNSSSNNNSRYRSDAKNNDFPTQIFRPRTCHGIAMRYHLIRDRKRLSSSLVPLILSSSSSGRASSPGVTTTGIEMKEVTGVIFCVGMGGGPVTAFGVGTSALTRSLGHRMKKSLGVLCNETTTTTASSSNNKKRGTVTTVMDDGLARSLLTTMLLTDDEDRMVNSVVTGEERIDVSQEEQFAKRLLAPSGSKKRSGGGVGGGGEENPAELVVNSADHARIIVERMAVLSVCSTDSELRKYENRQAARDAAAAGGGKTGKKRLRKLARDADLDGFDFRGEKRSSSIPGIDIRGHGVGGGGGGGPRSGGTGGGGGVGGAGDEYSVSAGSSFTGASQLTLKGPKKDTATKSANNRSRLNLQSPGLLASNTKDANGRNRRSSAEPIHNQRARNLLGRRTQSLRYEYDGGGGDAGGDGANSINNNAFHGSFSTSSTGDSFDLGSSTVRSPTAGGGVGVGSRTFSSAGRQQFDPFSDGRGNPTEALLPTDAFGRQPLPAPEIGDNNNNNNTKALVNVALNEDLTCFYKLSKLSSCSVEGVVQVQVRSNVNRTVPFCLLIKDPSSYIHTIQENKMYAKSVVDKTKMSDFAFNVSVPKAEEYFPVMRYKCGDELRPVPIVS